MDRGLFTKLYNENLFNEIKNLEFKSVDIFDFLKNEKNAGNSVFFHMRTMPYLPPSFVSKLYKAVFAAGYKYIVGVEQVGISRVTYQDFDFSEELRPSVIFRDEMFIHNYPGLLK